MTATVVTGSTTITASSISKNVAAVSTTSISAESATSASASTTAVAIQPQVSSTSTPSNQSNSFSNTLTSSPLNIGLTSLVSFLILVLLGSFLYFLFRCCKTRKERRIASMNSSSSRSGERDGDGILRTSEGDTYVGRGSWEDGYEKSQRLGDLDVRWERQVREANYRAGPYGQDQDDWKVEQDNYNDHREFNQPWDTPTRAVVKNNSPSSRKVVPQHQENYQQFPTNPITLTPHPRYKPFLLSTSSNVARLSLSSAYPQQSQPVRPVRPDQDPSLSAYLEHQVAPTFHDIDLGNPLATGSANNTSFNSPAEKSSPIWRTSLDRVLGAAAGFVVGKQSNSDGVLSPVTEERGRRSSIDSDISLQRTLLERPLKSPSLHKIPSLPIIVPPIPIPVTSQTRTPRQFFQTRVPVNRSLHPDLSLENTKNIDSPRSSASESPSNSPVIEVQIAHRVNLVEKDTQEVNRMSIVEEPRWMTPEVEVASSYSNVDDSDFFSDDRYSRASLFVQSPPFLQSRHQQQEIALNRASSSPRDNSSFNLNTATFNRPPPPPLPSTFSPYLTFPYASIASSSSTKPPQPPLLKTSTSLHSIRTVTSVSSLNSNSVWDDIGSPSTDSTHRHHLSQNGTSKDMNGERSFSVPSPRGSIIFDQRNLNGPSNSKSIEDLEAEMARAKRMEAEMERSKLLLDKTRKLAQARSNNNNNNGLSNSNTRY